MSKLLERTRELLSKLSTQEMVELSVKTGLPFSWLKAVRYHDSAPAVDRVEQLYEHLSGHKLEVK